MMNNLETRITWLVVNPHCAWWPKSVYSYFGTVLDFGFGGAALDGLGSAKN
jgi:hypothetical protein